MPTRTHLEASRDSPVSIDSTQVKKIGIIGGGASGAIVLDSLVKENHFEEIVLFERRNTFGGIWVFDDKSVLQHTPKISAGASRAELDPPLINPFKEKEVPVNSQKIGEMENLKIKDEAKASEFSKQSQNSQNSNNSPNKLVLEPSAQERFEPTPAYEQMKTNIIEKMMTYSDEKSWIQNGDPADSPYVERASVQKYIDRYIQRHANNGKVRIETGTTVEDVERVFRDTPKPQNSTNLPYFFRVTLRARSADGKDVWFQENFDSLVVATGHYHIPYIPEVPGSVSVQEAHPTVFEHAKFFTNGRKYKDKTVVVVGSRASGTDLTFFSSQHAAKVYQSVRTITNTKKLVKRDNVELKPVISKFEIAENGFSVVFEDGSRVDNPDHVIYATGYQFSYPYLEREFGDITLNGAIVPDLYQHTFLVQEPLIPIIGVPTDAISFRAFEFQAILVARFLAGKILLPAVSEQEKWLQARYKLHGQKRSYHTIGPQEARNYMKGLAQLGELGEDQPVVGRKFPDITESEVQDYVNAALARIDLWN